MLQDACKWLVVRVGYLLYTLALLALLLWLLFPREALSRLLVQYLNGAYPQLHWQMQSLSLQLPQGLTLQGIEGYGALETKKPQVRVDLLTMRPNIMHSLRTMRLQFEYRITMAQGIIAGTVQVDGWKRGLRVDGSVQGLQLAECAVLTQQLGRELQGTASATYGIDIPSQSVEGTLEAKLRVDDGRLGLKHPVLRQRVLPFSRATVLLHGRERTLQLEQGVVESELFSGQFSGDIHLLQHLTASPLDIKGTMQPRPALFTDVDNPSILQVIRTQFTDRNVPFQISGDLYNPGIIFEGLSPLLQSLDKELK